MIRERTRLVKSEPDEGGAKRLLEQVRDAIRLKHYSIRTEEAYVDWIKRYIYFHGIRHPAEMGALEVQAFLTHLAVDQNVAASTQNQALSALLFLYKEVLQRDLGPVDAIRAKKPRRLPTVLTRDEVHRLFQHLDGVHLLMARLPYGSGLRLMECIRLRVKDLGFNYSTITVRDGKGAKDRVTILPQSLVVPLRDHLRHVRRTHEEDLAKGYGAVYLPYALERKYPNAHREWIWQYIFPARRLSVEIRAVAPSVATTSTKAVCKKLSAPPLRPPISPSGLPLTPSAIPSPPTFWRCTTTFVLSRNSLATRTCVRP